MLKLTLDSERSELPNLITFKETPKLKCETKIDINFKIDEDFRRSLKLQCDEFLEKYPNSEGFNSRSLFIISNKDQILKNTEFIETENIMERVYILIYDLNPIDVVCPVCGVKKRFKRPKKEIGYSAGCCQKHSNCVMTHFLSPIVGPKIKSTQAKVTAEEWALRGKKNNETFKKNHPNETRSDIIKKVHKKRPELAEMARIRQTKWMEENKEKFLKAAKKAGETMKNQIDKNGLDHYQRVHLKKLNDIQNGLNFYERQKINANEKDENGMTRADRTRKNMEKLRKWVPLDELPDYVRYCKLVWKETKKQPIQMLENFEKRGKHWAGEDKDVYSLDHIYSISAGFKNNVPPCIIGSIFNLRFLRWDINLSKKDRCDISLDEILLKMRESILLNNK